MLHRPTIPLLGCLALCAPMLFACGDDKPSMADALAKADKDEAARKEAEANKKAAMKTAPTLADDPTKVDHPWTTDKLKASLKMGTIITYAVTGTDAKGKPVADEYRGEVKANNENDVGVVQTMISEADKPQATQVATLPWGRISPFFALERVQTELTGRETIETPAGTFDCVIADLKGFFGAHRTVWMPLDKPGIYAKVVDHGNANDEGGQTEITYVLKAIAVAP